MKFFTIEILFTVNKAFRVSNNRGCEVGRLKSFAFHTKSRGKSVI